MYEKGTFLHNIKLYHCVGFLLSVECIEFRCA